MNVPPPSHSATLATLRGEVGATQERDGGGTSVWYDAFHTSPDTSSLSASAISVVGVRRMSKSQWLSALIREDRLPEDQLKRL